MTLNAIREQAAARGIAALRVIVEPTGIYHKLLLRIAVSLGFQTALVDASHVKKMRSVIFGDSGKTDERDPRAIEAVAAQGRLIADRRHAEVYQLLRQWGKLYHDAEVAMIDAKSRVHRALTLLFPDFDFTTDFLYGPSGRPSFAASGSVSQIGTIRVAFDDLKLSWQALEVRQRELRMKALVQNMRCRDNYGCFAQAKNET